MLYEVITVNLVAVESPYPFILKDFSQPLVKLELPVLLFHRPDMSLPGGLELHLPVIFEQVNKVLDHV